MSGQVIRLKVPSFDLITLRLEKTSEGGDTAKDSTHFVLVPGGGGSTKSGVKNQIQIGQVYDGAKVRFSSNFCTDTEGSKLTLCCSLSAGQIDDVDLVCGAFDDKCIVYVVKANEANDTIDFEAVTTFTADYSCDLPTVNCSCFAPGTNRLITGGQDGGVRVWELKHTGGQWESGLLRELMGHSGPIMSLVVHPGSPEKWVASASRDGTCLVWDHTVDCKKLSDEGKETAADASKPAVVATINGKETVLQNSDTSKTPNAANATFECRGCCFSPSGHELFMLMCPRKGNATVIRWLLVATKASSSTEVKLVPTMLHLLVVCDVPCTKLRINEDGRHLAVGTSSGHIVVVDVVGKSSVNGSDTKGEGAQLSKCVMKIGWMKENIHDLPVTGMAFLDNNAEKDSRKPTVVLTCSADNKFIATIVPRHRGSFLSVQNLLFLLVAVILLLAVVVKRFNVEPARWLRF